MGDRSHYGREPSIDWATHPAGRRHRPSVRGLGVGRQGILPPPGEHEGMDLQRGGHCLDLQAGLLAQSYGRERECVTGPMQGARA